LGSCGRQTYARENGNRTDAILHAGRSSHRRRSPRAGLERV